MPEVTVLGVYRLDVSPELVDEAITRRMGLRPAFLPKEEQESIEIETRAELSRVVLVEVLVKERDRSMYMGHFGQSRRGGPLGANDPVAYNEVFLSLDGEEKVADYLDLAPRGDLRAAFYLHDYDAGLPLLTSYGAVSMPPPAPMPGRLARLVPYEPPGE